MGVGLTFQRVNASADVFFHVVDGNNHGHCIVCVKRHAGANLVSFGFGLQFVQSDVFCHCVEVVVNGKNKTIFSIQETFVDEVDL